jgi:N-acetyl-anhydromuramyl-L-alanine amidase AmpD
VTYPFIHAKWYGKTQKEVRRIVLHGTVSPTVRGQAMRTAQYFANVTRPSSAHYAVDPFEIWQCLPDNLTAYHDGTNVNSIGVEMCDMVDGHDNRWGDQLHQNMIKLTSVLVRELCAKYSIPMVRLSVADVRGNLRGICGHSDMRDAFPGSTTHYDPGKAFPWEQFMAYVQAPPSVLLRNRSVMYIWCEQKDKTITCGILSGGKLFGPLSKGEEASARGAILKGAVEQWVEVSTWDMMKGIA